MNRIPLGACERGVAGAGKAGLSIDIHITAANTHILLEADCNNGTGLGTLVRGFQVLSCGERGTRRCVSFLLCSRLVTGRCNQDTDANLF